MFRWFEQRISPFKPSPATPPPNELLGFYWYFIRQCKSVIFAVLIVGLVVALIEVLLFAFLGELVNLMTAAETPASFFSDHGELLLWMAFVALILRPIVYGIQLLLVNHAILPNFTALIRWQTHKHVLHQSVSFFHNDFAGRIANKVMQTAPSLRESVIQVIDTLWFVSIYAILALGLFAQSDFRLMIPLILWMLTFVLLLWYFVPRVKERAKLLSESRSSLTGRIVDSYTNILTAKLFSHTDREESYAGEAIRELTQRFFHQMRLISTLETCVIFINGSLIVATCGLGIWLWSQDAISLGAIALSTGLVIRINNMALWVMFVVTGIFENLGAVHEGMETIAKPHTVIDRTDATKLNVNQGEICFNNVTFAYDDANPVIKDLNLKLHAGERIGIVGPSGAGKSTLVNLLMRFYDIEHGDITIDGYDISTVTQQSLRANIGVVTQDSSLLHRSAKDNILYGRPDADIDVAVEAAKRAHAHEFILGLRDLDGRTGYDAYVGERGVKLSGGQRQRITIARVLVKDAPILVLDEATSALDSEVEAAIQQQLNHLMHGKTVIAIAHRLSTIAAMDRLVVIDQGRIVGQGSHRELLAENGLYTKLWQHQSGGFLGDI